MTRRAGRPRYRDENQVRERILSLIPEDDKGIRWIDLERKARSLGISLSTVRKYFTRLETGRIIERRVDQDARPPAVYYRRTHDRYFKDIVKSTATTTPAFQEYLKDLGEIHLESFATFNEALASSLKKLHKMRSAHDVEDEQGRLFLFYGNMFLCILSNLLTDYSDTASPEEADSFFREALNALLLPLLSAMAKIADPKFGRCKYTMEDARQAIAESLSAQLKHYKRYRAAFRERVESIQREMRNLESRRGVAR